MGRKEKRVKGRNRGGDTDGRDVGRINKERQSGIELKRWGGLRRAVMMER